MTRAVCYVRVSTREQAEGGVSLEAQGQAVRAYCAMRGLEVAEVVVDAGVSAGKALDTREGGRRVLDAVRRRGVSAVVAYKLDRLFRDCADCLDVTKTWDRLDVSLHLVDLGGQAIDTSTAMGRFFLTVMAGAAEMERNLIRERTSAALAHKAANGERVGQVPYGYRAEGRDLVEDEDEQRFVRTIMAWREGGHSIRRIARLLNENGIEARGARWHPTTVARIIKRAT